MQQCDVPREILRENNPKQQCHCFPAQTLKKLCRKTSSTCKPGSSGRAPGAHWNLSLIFFPFLRLGAEEAGRRKGWAGSIHSPEENTRSHSGWQQAAGAQRTRGAAGGGPIPPPQPLPAPAAEHNGAWLHPGPSFAAVPCPSVPRSAAGQAPAAANEDSQRSQAPRCSRHAVPPARGRAEQPRSTGLTGRPAPARAEAGGWSRAGVGGPGLDAAEEPRGSSAPPLLLSAPAPRRCHTPPHSAGAHRCLLTLPSPRLRRTPAPARRSSASPAARSPPPPPPQPPLPGSAPPARGERGSGAGCGGGEGRGEQEAARPLPLLAGGAGSTAAAAGERPGAGARAGPEEPVGPCRGSERRRRLRARREAGSRGPNRPSWGARPVRRPSGPSLPSFPLP